MRKKPSGELVGTYAITGALVENTCGQTARSTPDPLIYTVHVRDDDGVGTWQLEKQGAQAGTLDDEGKFAFLAESSTPMGEQTRPKQVLEANDFLSGDPDADLYRANCTLLTRESMRGTLHRRLQDADAGMSADAGMDDADLVGVNTIEIQPAPGSDCTLQLAAVGGAYLALPCRVEYEIEGALQLED
jgi:hypothetical protein